MPAENAAGALARRWAIRAATAAAREALQAALQVRRHARQAEREHDDREPNSAGTRLWQTARPRQQVEVQAEPADDERRHVHGVGEDEEGERLVGDLAARHAQRRSAHAVSAIPPAPPAANRRVAARPAIVIW